MQRESQRIGRGPPGEVAAAVTSPVTHVVRSKKSSGNAAAAPFDSSAFSSFSSFPMSSPPRAPRSRAAIASRADAPPRLSRAASAVHRRRRCRAAAGFLSEHLQRSIVPQERTETPRRDRSGWYPAWPSTRSRLAMTLASVAEEDATPSPRSARPGLLSGGVRVRSRRRAAGASPPRETTTAAPSPRTRRQTTAAARRAPAPRRHLRRRGARLRPVREPRGGRRARTPRVRGSSFRSPFGVGPRVGLVYHARRGDGSRVRVKPGEDGDVPPPKDASATPWPGRSGRESSARPRQTSGRASLHDSSIVTSPSQCLEPGARTGPHPPTGRADGFRSGSRRKSARDDARGGSVGLPLSAAD